MYTKYRLKNGNTKIQSNSDRTKYAIWSESQQRFIFNSGVYKPALEQARRELCRRR